MNMPELLWHNIKGQKAQGGWNIKAYLLHKNPTHVYVPWKGPEDIPSLEQKNAWVGHKEDL